MVKERIALVTGAGRGIGRAIALGLARDGVDLVLTARTESELTDVAREVEQQGQRALCVVADLASPEAPEKLFAEIKPRGDINILVNNAGIHKSASFMDYSFEDFRNIVDVNLYSVFHVSQATLPKMIERQAGRIINIASSAGKWGSRNQSAYNASKHAVVGVTRCLALEMAPHNILTNAICPWIVETDLADSFMREHSAAAGLSVDAFTDAIKNSVPMKRWIQPEEVANLAVFLASDESSYINGQSWSVDGGYTAIAQHALSVELWMLHQFADRHECGVATPGR